MEGWRASDNGWKGARVSAELSILKGARTGPSVSAKLWKLMMKSQREQAPKHGGGHPQPRLQQRGPPGVLTAKGQGSWPSAAWGTAIHHFDIKVGFLFLWPYLEGCQLPYILRKGCQLIIMKIQNLRKEDKLSTQQRLTETTPPISGPRGERGRLGLCRWSSTQPFLSD